MEFHFLMLRRFFWVFLFVLLCNHNPKVYGDYTCVVKNKIFSETVYKTPEKSFAIYLKHYRQVGYHDFRLLRKMSEFILNIGYQTNDPYLKKCCVLGAGISGSSSSLEILSKAAEESDYVLQLLTLSVLNNFTGKTVESILLTASGSPHPIVKMEAIYRLALLRYPYVIDRLRTFLDKIPHSFKPLIGNILIHIENEESNAYIKQLLCDSDPVIRSQIAVLAAENNRDYFLNNVRNLAHGAHPCEREAAAFALGKLQDFSCYEYLKTGLNKKNSYVKIASALALGLLGRDTEVVEILKREICDNNNPFAVHAFHYFPKEHAEKILLPIFKTTENEEIKFNCAEVLTSLQVLDPAPYEYITEILLSKEHRPFFVPACSPGYSLSYYKMISNSQSLKMLYENSYALNDQIYAKLLKNLISAPDSYLSRDTVIKLLKTQEEKLNPILMNFIGNRGSIEDLKILEAASELPGIPFTRAYANMLLYKITQDPQKAAVLRNWVKEAVTNTVLLEEKESSSDFKKKPFLKFMVTPEQKTQLLVEALETLVQSKKEEDIALFLEMLSHKENKNFYLLVGLLIKIAE
ncbi:MAG: hypothetical protein RRZ72_02295 [Victivallaceae bacterium]